MEMVELLVRMDCKGCERTIRKTLSKIKGVNDVEVDLEQQKVTVIGYVNQMKVLRSVRKSGRAAELWNPMQQEDYQFNYVNTPLAFSKTYNYEIHGFNRKHHHVAASTLYSNYHHIVEEDELEGANASMFSDDNPNACSIM